MARVQEKFQRQLATQVRSRKERFIELLQQAVSNTGGTATKKVNLTRDDLTARHDIHEGPFVAAGGGSPARGVARSCW